MRANSSHGGRLGALRRQRPVWTYVYRAGADTTAALYTYERAQTVLVWAERLPFDPENAVDPQNFEPNLALDLEISDLINSKKGNAYGKTV